jgi:hypothetical protein
MAYRQHYGPYRGYWRDPSDTHGLSGDWYAEYSGWPAVRQFLVSEDGMVAVAPFDFTFLDRPTPDELPALSDGHAGLIERAEFEEAWARFAQPRLNLWAHGMIGAVPATPDISYFLIPFPASLKVNEPSSLLYYEYASLFRRMFEVWEDGRVEAGQGPEGDAEEFLHMAHEGAHLDGTPLGPEERVLEISHASFEREWEHLMIPHLLSEAGLRASKKTPENEKGGEA